MMKQQVRNVTFHIHFDHVLLQQVELTNTKLSVFRIAPSYVDSTGNGLNSFDETPSEHENAQKDNHDDQDQEIYQNTLENDDQSDLQNLDVENDDQSDLQNLDVENDDQAEIQNSDVENEDNNDQTNTDSPVSYEKDDVSKFDVRLESFNETETDQINSLANDTDPDIDYSNYDNDDSENESVTGMSQLVCRLTFCVEFCY